MTMIDRDEVARMVVTVSRNHADGYKRNISEFNTERENEIAEKCSIAASNTGFFLLQALGFSGDEIKALRQQVS